MMRYLKFIIVVILDVISFKTIPNAAGTSDELGEWFFPLTMGFIFIPMIYYVLKAFREVWYFIAQAEGKIIANFGVKPKSLSVLRMIFRVPPIPSASYSAGGCTITSTSLMSCTLMVSS